MEIKTIKISEIIPYDKNPRRNDRAAEIVEKSIKEFGFLVPIILDKNNEVVAGHTRIKAAEKLGIKEIPCIYATDLTKEQVKAFRIMDNKSHEYSRWDWKLLKEEFQELKDLNFDLELTGFSGPEIDWLLGLEEDEVKTRNPKYNISDGEIWKLGDHKIICADSRKSEAFEKLMGGGQN